MIRRMPLFLCVIVGLILIAPMPGTAQSASMKRGRDWMDLKRYDEAIAEFRNAIREEPKNVEARYLVARCYYLKREPLQALSWTQETLSVGPNHVGAVSLRNTIQREGVGYLSSNDSGIQLLGLAITERVPSRSAIGGLTTLMASPDGQIARRSESLLVSIDPKAARAVWIDWLVSPELRLQEAGAEKLWDMEK